MEPQRAAALGRGYRRAGRLAAADEANVSNTLLKTREEGVINAQMHAWQGSRTAAAKLVK